MAKYYVNVDEKVSVWRRNKVLVEAESKKEAQDKVINEIKDNGNSWYMNVDLIDCEYLGETEESLEPSQNNGIATLEVLDDKFITRWANVKK